MFNLKSFAIFALLGLSPVLGQDQRCPKPKTKTITKTQTQVVTVTATPSAAPTCGSTLRYTAQYDDLEFRESPDEPNAPGLYKGLIYENFYVDEYDGFIQPKSFNNTLISYDYRIPRVIRPQHGTFDLYTMFVACSSGYPQAACEIKIQGKTKDGALKHMTYVYPALDSSIGLHMTSIPFKQWYDLVEIRILDARLLDRPVDTEFRPAFVMDDLRYLLKEQCTGCSGGDGTL